MESVENLPFCGLINQQLPWQDLYERNGAFEGMYTCCIMNRKMSETVSQTGSPCSDLNIL